MLKIREITCKTILNKSSLCDFTLNCYVGCSHRCLYCYAAYMKKFKDRREAWGNFLDVKVNAPEVLSKQIKKISLPKEVYMSTVCDGWQPAEAKYKLSRACLKILLEAGFCVSILTKNKLILRDFDLLTDHKKLVSLGVTITTTDSALARTIEPFASEPAERLKVLKEAQKQGIKTYCFLGPLMPEITDTKDNLKNILSALGNLNLSYMYVDKLNPRWGVLDTIKKGLNKGPYNSKLSFLLETYKSPIKHRNYNLRLKHNCRNTAAEFGLKDKLNFCF